MADDRVFAKCAWRLIPFIMVMLFANLLDRVNAGFAALTMNRDLGFTPAVFGFGAGLVFLSYALFQLPANIVLARVGAKRFVFSIMTLWAVFSTKAGIAPRRWCRPPPSTFQGPRKRSGMAGRCAVAAWGVRVGCPGLDRAMRAPPPPRQD
jgi:MFS family permease